MSQNILIVGSEKTGKTVLMNHLSRSYFEPFTNNYHPTIGIDLVGYQIKDSIRYVFWDSSGNDRFFPLIEPYFKSCNIILIAFDLSTTDFQDLQSWYDKTNAHSKPTVIVGTKHDKVGEGSEQLLMACIKFCQDKEVPFFPTSSTTGMGIDELRNALQRLIPSEEILSKSIQRCEQQQTQPVKKQSFLKKLFCCVSKNNYQTIQEQSSNYPENILSYVSV